MKKITYFDFINNLPENAIIKLRSGQDLSSSEFIKQFEAMTGHNSKKIFMVGCEFTIYFKEVFEEESK